MSLTRHLDSPTSPVRVHLEQTFPHLRALRHPLPPGETPPDARPDDLRLPGPDTFPPIAVRPPDPAPAYPWGTVGTAFDYRFRYLLAPQDPTRFVAATGAQMLRRWSRLTAGADVVGGHVWDELVAELATVPDQVRPGQQEDVKLARLCLVLAWYEEYFRIDPPYHVLTEIGSSARLEDLVAHLDPQAVDDLVNLTDLAVTRHPGLTRPESVVFNPTFARSGDLGGADADLICDGQQLELKTTTKLTLRRLVTHQLLGYLLADTDDQYQIGSVGWYFARHGVWWSFPAQVFCNRLAGRSVDLAEERDRFAKVCAALQDTDE